MKKILFLFILFGIVKMASHYMLFQQQALSICLETGKGCENFLNEIKDNKELLKQLDYTATDF